MVSSHEALRKRLPAKVLPNLKEVASITKPILRAVEKQDIK